MLSGTGGPVTRGMRRMLWVAAGLVLVQGSILLAARNDTSRYFSWTIAVPVTAAFLVAGYLAAVVLEAAAARQAAWLLDTIESGGDGYCLHATMRQAPPLGCAAPPPAGAGPAQRAGRVWSDRRSGPPPVAE